MGKTRNEQADSVIFFSLLQNQMIGLCKTSTGLKKKLLVDRECSNQIISYMRHDF